jgi:hypothetical protein
MRLAYQKNSLYRWFDNTICEEVFVVAGCGLEKEERDI